jgi:hypothetical protein
LLVQLRTTGDDLQIDPSADLDRVRKIWGGCKQKCQSPPFVWHGSSIWGHNHELIAPHDHGVFVGMVTTSFSRTFCLETEFSCLTVLGFN